MRPADQHKCGETILEDAHRGVPFRVVFSGDREARPIWLVITSWRIGYECGEHPLSCARIRAQEIVDARLDRGV